MRKKSIRLAASTFIAKADEVMEFVERAGSAEDLTDLDESWCYDLAIIRLYREFEDLMLSCLVALINGDSATFSEHKKRSFPRHMNAEVCEYLICGDGYFDFSGRAGLIKTIKRVVPNNHWLPAAVGQADYTDALNQLSSLRNFAAHDSAVSKKRALESIDQERMSSSGAWLKRQDRLQITCDSLKDLAQAIHHQAPH